MANEARVQMSLQIRKGNLNYISQPNFFLASVPTARGPIPGGITVPTTGTNIDFSGLTNAGICWIHNLSLSNYVRWGVHDGTIFHPLGKLLPGEIAIIRLDDDLGEEESDTGTGGTVPPNHFYMKAVGGSCDVRVEAFEG